MIYISDCAYDTISQRKMMDRIGTAYEQFVNVLYTWCSIVHSAFSSGSSSVPSRTALA